MKNIVISMGNAAGMVKNAVFGKRTIRKQWKGLVCQPPRPSATPP